MSVIFIVLPLALILGGLAVAACIWATSRGQFDDLDTPPLRVATDEGEENPAGPPCR
jgi:cbb3-type cytochrome oxidase maturation protein